MNTFSIPEIKKTLRFNKDGSFRILCVSDIHGGVGYDEETTVKYLNALVDNTHPGLILMIGDIAGPGEIHINTPEELRTMLKGLTRHIEEMEIPWAQVYGNHDNNFGVPNEVSQTVYEEFPFNVSYAGPEDIQGCGNWVLPVLSTENDDAKFYVWGLDSNCGNNTFRSEFGIKNETDDEMTFPYSKYWDGNNRGIDFSQVDWYYNMSRQLEKKDGRKNAGMMIMHVPVFEMGMMSVYRQDLIFDGLDRNDTDVEGFNTGLFRACVERGDIKAMCFGHNHHDSYGAEYCGIKLCYDGYLSRHACHCTPTLGGRIFDINESNPFDIATKFIPVTDVLDIPAWDHTFNET